MRRKPNFFLVGTAKAGTTSLWRYFDQHPEIFVPSSDLFKEPAYFCQEFGIKEEKKYLNIFKSARNEHKAIGECSTAYMTCIDSPNLICDYANQNNIDPKIIIMLRNPADRAYSLYNWNVLSGLEPASNFSKALNTEANRMHTNLPSFWLPSGYRKLYYYFQTGLYFAQVSQYMRLFSKENIYIGLFEDFRKRPTEILQEIFKFLNVRDYSIPKTHVYNPSYSVVSPKLQVILRNMTNILIRLHIIRNFKSIKERDRLLAFGLKKCKPNPIELVIKQKLIERYRTDILKLQTLIKKDLSFWLN